MTSIVTNLLEKKEYVIVLIIMLFAGNIYQYMDFRTASTVRVELVREMLTAMRDVTGKLDALVVNVEKAIELQDNSIDTLHQRVTTMSATSQEWLNVFKHSDQDRKILSTLFIHGMNELRDKCSLGPTVPEALIPSTSPVYKD